MKTTRIILFILIIIGIGLLATQKIWVPKLVNIILKSENITIPENVPGQQTMSLCYLYHKGTNRGFSDDFSLNMKITGNNVSGEYKSLPAEKDSKIGTFKGTVGPLDKKTMSRTANVWWDSFAEGMKVTEELIINFGDGSAVVGSGEMIDRGDGVYVYKDKTKITYSGPTMSQVACEVLDKK